MSKEIRRPKPDKKRLRRTLLMAALESPLGIMNAYEIVTTASPRMFGCAISGGDHIKYSLKFVWPMSILTLIASTLLGVIPF